MTTISKLLQLAGLQRCGKKQREKRGIDRGASLVTRKKNSRATSSNETFQQADAKKFFRRNERRERIMDAIMEELGYRAAEEVGRLKSPPIRKDNSLTETKGRSVLRDRE